MTGIERLLKIACNYRDLSRNQRYLGINVLREADLLDDIAGQIERELREERSRWDDELCDAQMDKTCVMAVYLEMNRHVLGHEGMEDSPVARWARELRGALKSDASDGSEAQSPSCADAAETADVTSEDRKVTRDPAADVSMSAYDLLPEEDRDAVAWVREHGGLDSVKAQRRESMPRAAYERKKAGFLGHIAECETALGRRSETISELNHRACDLTRENAELRKRAMPEGFEWPRFESGEPVMLGDSVTEYVAGGEFEVRSIEFRDGAVYLRECYKTDRITIVRPGERVKRPAPKVLDADGVEIRVGDTVWPRYSSANRDAQVERAEVVGIQAKYGRVDVRTVYATGLSFLEQVDADRLTHQRPDSWERLGEDAKLPPLTYCIKRGIADMDATDADNARVMATDLVRRARALAGDA